MKSILIIINVNINKCKNLNKNNERLPVYYSLSTLSLDKIFVFVNREILLFLLSKSHYNFYYNVLFFLKE